MNALQSQGGTGIVQDAETLATLGTVVTGVAADSAARIVARVYANSPGDALTVSLQPTDNVANSNNITQPIGSLQSILPADGTQSGSQITVIAVNTSAGPMGFVLYTPPQGFSRGGPDDAAASRSVNIAAQSSATALSSSTTVTIWRPPVILVHGLWGDPSDWNNFTPFLTDSRFNDSGFRVHRAGYNYATSGGLSNSMPNYSNLEDVHTNSLGFEFNASPVLNQIQEAIIDFRQSQQAAATQVDVVAHSMGGLVTRRLQYLPQYTDWSSFGFGNLHKLITIGTPHLGSPLAGLLLADSCVQGWFAQAKRFAISSVIVNGEPFSGGVGDLQGDGSNDSSLSPGLLEIQTSTPHEVPTYTIAGTMIPSATPPSNTSTLNCTICRAEVIRLCGTPLANDLTPLGWPAVFGGLASDAIVPVNSQLNGNLSAPQVSGLIHSAGLEDINFTGPGELDSASSTNLVQSFVIQALNFSVTNSAFMPLP